MSSIGDSCARNPSFRPGSDRLRLSLHFFSSHRIPGAARAVLPHPHVKRTCEVRDPSNGDRSLPAPVLALT